MPRQGEVVRLIRVFVSSPGDVNAERAVLDEVVQRINETTGLDKGARLELFRWERNVVPRIGLPAQAVIDAQTPAYDFSLGIMAHRFGTPSGEYGSGTEAEFRAPAPEWRPALSFVFGSLVVRSASPEPGIRLLTRLIGLAEPAELGLQVVIGECVEMLIGRGIRLQPADEERVRGFCLAAIEREAPLPERHALGLTLGRLGDPRIVHDLRDRAAYVEVPADTYLLGDERKRFTLGRSFMMSRYPVTNSQFALFIKEGGYEEARWWSEGGRRWLAESGAREPELWRRGKWNNPSQPVIGVSFWEAEAFSTWTGGRLPTADEWECAARGPRGCEYPWGDDWEDGICNTVEARLGGTSAVGLFPRSRSKAFRLEDMAGNVWEWCSHPTQRDRVVVRGGSWGLGARGARSAVRVDVLPVDRHVYFGFRVVGAGGVRTP